MVYTIKSEQLTEDLMDSRMAYVSQKDVTDPDQVKVRYISGPRVEINPRIDTDRHPRRIVPKQQNVARAVLYSQRRYHGVDVLLRKRDVEGAFKLIPAALSGLSYMGCIFSQFLATYLSMFFRMDAVARQLGGRSLLFCCCLWPPSNRPTHTWTGHRRTPHTNT